MAIYVDGIYYPRPTNGILRLNNIERIEAIAGPQGTLFGRNASGGLIHIVTRDPKPGDAAQLDAQFGYANYRTVDGQIYAAGSLSDKIAVDLAALYRNQDKGWGRNLTTSRDIYLEEQFLVRGKLVFALNDATKIKLTLDYARSDTSIGYLDHIRGYRQGLPDRSGPLPEVGFYDILPNRDPENITVDKGVAAHVEHEFQSLTLANIFSYRTLKASSFFVDSDYSPQDFVNAYVPPDTHQVSNELQLRSNGSGPLQFTAGLFYLHQYAAYNPGYLTGTAFGTRTSIRYGKQVTNSYAAYAQANAKVLSNLQITLGGRYSIDKLKGSGFAYLSNTGVPGTPDLVVSPPTTASRRFNNFSFKAAAQYDFDRDVMAYASVSRGYKSATFNTFPFVLKPALPEVITAYEVGLKSELFNRRVRINISGFYYDIKNPQVNTSPGPGTVNVENARAARSKGIDVESLIRVATGLDARLGVSLLDAKYTDYPNAPFLFPNPLPPYGNLPAVPGDAKGKDMPQAPHTVISAGLSYETPLPTGKLGLSANVYHNSGYYFFPDNRVRQDSFTTLDASATYTFGDPRYQLRVFMSNIANKRYYMSGAEIAGQAGDLGGPAAPRTYGVSLRFQL